MFVRYVCWVYVCRLGVCVECLGREGVRTECMLGVCVYVACMCRVYV